MAPKYETASSNFLLDTAGVSGADLLRDFEVWKFPIAPYYSKQMDLSEKLGSGEGSEQFGTKH